MFIIYITVSYAYYANFYLYLWDGCVSVVFCTGLVQGHVSCNAVSVPVDNIWAIELGKLKHCLINLYDGHLTWGHNKFVYEN